MKKALLYIPILMLALAAGAAAQSSGEGETEEDPFRNDPFFSKPLEEFFKKPSEESERNEESRDVRHYVDRLQTNGIDFDSFVEAGPYNSSALYSFYPNMPMIHFNRVSGLFLGIEQERMQWYASEWLFDISGIQPHGLIGYSFAQRNWDYIAGLEKLFGRKRYLMAGAEIHNATGTDDYWRVGLTETTFTSFFGGYDYLDYYRQKGWGAYLLLRTPRLFEGGVAFSDDRFTSLRKETDWALFGSGGRYRENPPVDIQSGAAVDTLEIGSFAFAAAFNPKRLILSRNFTFTLSAMIEIADPATFDTDFDYSKYEAELITHVNFEPGGVFRYRLRAGSITGDAPNLKEFQLGGLGSLRALPYKSLPVGLANGGHFGNQMLLSNAEIQFGSPEFGNSDWIDFDDFYLSLFLDSGWVDYSPDLAASDNPFTGYSEFSFSDLRHNGGVGLGSSLFRFELAWDLDNTSRSPVLWVRLNPTF